MTNETMTWQERMMQEIAESERLDAAGEQGEPVANNPVEPNNKPNEDGTVDSRQTQATALANMVSLATPKETETNPDSSVEEYKAKIAELEAALQKAKSEDGRARRLADTVRELEESNRQLMERLNENSRVQPIEGDVDVFNDEEREIISDEAQKIIGSRFAKMKLEYEEMKRKQDELLSRFNRVDDLARQNDMNEMQRSIQQAFPNFETMINGDAWKAFCAEQDPVSKMSNGKLFVDAYEHNDASAVNAMIQRFMMATGVGVGHIAVGARAPETSFGSTTPNSVSTQTFDAATVDKFLQAALSGRINMSDPRNVALYNTYTAALDEGRVI